MRSWSWSVAFVLLALLLAACGGDFEDDAFFEEEAFDASEAGAMVDESFAETEPPAVDASESVVAESAPQDAESVPADCPFAIPDGYEIACGVLRVPENRGRADSPTIELAYAVVYAATDQGRPPLVYLAGGPGGSAIDDFVADPEGWDYPFTRTRDLILLDQRGTGYSLPTLDCPELAEEVAFGDENPEEACHSRLAAAGIDLAAYNTVENAADVEALRRALGIASWDLLGISYGTRLALIVMRDYPAGVRSAVLDSAFPPNADTADEEALASYWSLEQLFADCAADGYCDENYPDLESVFLETVAAMNEDPLDGVFGDDLAFTVFQALNDTNLIPLVPYVIYAVADGDIGALDEIATDTVGSGRYQAEADRSDSEGMYNSVICHEEYVFGDYATAETRLIAEAPEAIQAVLMQPVADLFQVCSYWGAGAAAPRENEAVRSDLPTLILAGQYDNATPPGWAYLAAETLPNAFVYEFPGAGHSLLSADQCAIDITTAFLDAPDRAPDGSCIAEIEWPYFE
jgi:pimeloyl-ACP methyl ester carboxylesterase